MSAGSKPAAGPNGSLPRIETALLGTFTVVWVFVFLAYARWVPLAGILDLDLYRLYSFAAVLGWASGNIYMLRRRSRPAMAPYKKRLLLVYGVGPVSLLLLMRALAFIEVQEAAPFVPLYTACVYGLFFLVPVTLKATQTPRRS